MTGAQAPPPPWRERMRVLVTGGAGFFRSSRLRAEPGRKAEVAFVAGMREFAEAVMRGA